MFEGCVFSQAFKPLCDDSDPVNIHAVWREGPLLVIL